jgi:phosphate:Na+ symporter
MIASVIGGLGIFLLGMKNMSDGMQAVTGSRMRRLVGAVTDNRLLAAGVGTLTTCLVQSSSVTTVMVIGFVNSGVMQLTQAVGVIMSANIGTTITGWILALHVGKYGLPILGTSAFVYLFSKGDRWRYWAMAIMGVGMVFFGLELMKDACARVREMPDFEAWFHRFNADSYFGVLMCALAGCVLTMVVQSSSATLGITIALAGEGVIPFETAAALVLGENIGTTITAYLASLGATTNARRAAYFHVIFNVIGVLWVTAIFAWYIELIHLLVPDISKEVVVDGITTYPNTLPGIATTHTLFNVVNTILFLPIVPLVVKLLQRIVPAKTYKEKPRLTDLDIRMLETPLVAIEQSRIEILKMGDGCRKMLEWQKTLYEQDEPDRTLIDKLNHRERVLDTVHDEVTAYVTGLLSGNVPHSVAEEARRQLRMADEYESVSDYVADLLKFDTKLRADGHRFTEKQRRGLVALNDLVSAYVVAVNEGNMQQNLNVHDATEAARKHISSDIKRLRRTHLDDLSDHTIPPLVSVAYMAALNAFARVRDHTHNIAETVSGEK